MARTFNCGIGAVLVVQKELAQQVLKDVQKHEAAWLIGKVVPLQKGYWIFIFLDKNEKLNYFADASPCCSADELLIGTSVAFVHRVLSCQS